MFSNWELCWIQPHLLHGDSNVKQVIITLTPVEERAKGLHVCVWTELFWSPYLPMWALPCSSYIFFLSYTKGFLFWPQQFPNWKLIQSLLLNDSTEWKWALHKHRLLKLKHVDQQYVKDSYFILNPKPVEFFPHSECGLYQNILRFGLTWFLLSPTFLPTRTPRDAWLEPHRSLDTHSWHEPSVLWGPSLQECSQ